MNIIAMANINTSFDDAWYIRKFGEFFRELRHIPEWKIDCEKIIEEFSDPEDDEAVKCGLFARSVHKWIEYFEMSIAQCLAGIEQFQERWDEVFDVLVPQTLDVVVFYQLQIYAYEDRLQVFLKSLQLERNRLSELKLQVELYDRSHYRE